jgi:hypothetical protein
MCRTGMHRVKLRKMADVAFGGSVISRVVMHPVSMKEMAESVSR